MSIAKTGVYWPFKTILQGAGISLVETADSIQIIATGTGGPGGGDMLQSEYAPTGIAGKVDHAILADTATNTNYATNAGSVPWTGITALPTNFPTDWTYIANKPSAFPPLQHRATHVTGGSDIIVPAGPATSGLLNILSGLDTDFVGGDNACHNLNTEVGENPLTMNALFTALAGSNFQGGITQLTDTRFQIANPNGKPAGIYNTAAGAAYNVGWFLGHGADLLHDSCQILKPPGGTALNLAYYNAAGAVVYDAEILTTYCPSGTYSFRTGVRIIGSGSLPGSNTAWSLAPFLANSSVAGGFIGYGMVCNNYWGCVLGAYTSGLWIATSANTFRQLTDTNGQIVGSALVGGAVTTNLGYRPVSSGGDTMVGDLWVSKATAQIIAYQNGTNYVRLLGGPDGGSNGQGLTVAGINRCAGGYGGMIYLNNTGTDRRAGITFQTSNGRVAQLYLDGDGALRWTDYNTNQTFTISMV
jgi:hypothetical protein